ncbi:TPA: FkbM family methyltransferase [Vibrio vulnificus]|uniref:FkbM family methyltransferase n=1 Tax=Vibrio vulnificus TaxID=672 RepID=UPI0019D464CD|nr:FkbM family methyltransferase [Vibrio vulnificus]MBN8090645.1 FkbM family methyltransferase [Vibrio vulnificus]MBN8118089.1 FkbM family methyltransferase [Vibrio vulnificus]
MSQLIDDVLATPEDAEHIRDYFSWGQDTRHKVDNTEVMPTPPKQKNIVRRTLARWREHYQKNSKSGILRHFRRRYSQFEASYQLMSDEASKRLFAELLLVAIISDKRMVLSSFSQEFIDSYEQASQQVLDGEETLEVYEWILRKVEFQPLGVQIFTGPEMLNLLNTGRLYRYERDGVCIDIESGDVVLDAGVGWGDTTICLAKRAHNGGAGHLYAFDILADGMAALDKQLTINPAIDNLTPILKALSDTEGEIVNITSPSPGARVSDQDTGTQVETTTLDHFARQQALTKVDFIKMDIEGAEVPAINGAREIIIAHKPKLAISVYHKWDDLLVIPALINSIRDDYEFYLDCTTGFGGEAVLYCR